MVMDLLEVAEPVEENKAKIRLAYEHAEKGRWLLEAGMLEGNREYVERGRPDPFRWPEVLRRAALGGMGGWECDDSAAFPRARMAMLETGKAETEFFIKHRKEILDKCGRVLFEEERDAAVRYAQMKGTTNGYDMDSGIDAWRKKYKGPEGRSAKNVRVKLKCGEWFSMEEYWRAQRKGTEEMKNRSERALRMLRGAAGGDEKAVAKVDRTWKSYVLQEAEATSREAKITWCRENGISVGNLQHDGIYVYGCPEGMTREGLEKGMSEAASKACGFPVVVVSKEIEVPTMEEVRKWGNEVQKGAERKEATTGGGEDLDTLLRALQDEEWEALLAGTNGNEVGELEGQGGRRGGKGKRAERMAAREAKERREAQEKEKEDTGGNGEERDEEVREGQEGNGEDEEGWQEDYGCDEWMSAEGEEGRAGDRGGRREDTGGLANMVTDMSDEQWTAMMEQAEEEGRRQTAVGEVIGDVTSEEWDVLFGKDVEVRERGDGEGRDGVDETLGDMSATELEGLVRCAVPLLTHEGKGRGAGQGLRDRFLTGELRRAAAPPRRGDSDTPRGGAARDSGTRLQGAMQMRLEQGSTPGEHDKVSE